MGVDKGGGVGAVPDLIFRLRSVARVYAVWERNVCSSLSFDVPVQQPAI